MIVTKNLQKAFGDHMVLKGIDQHIEKGEKVVVIGPSGSGKSTFLRCLNLLEQPTGGEIIFEGTTITDPSCNINELRQRMGMVFQQFNLFPHKTVRQNITLAPVLLGKMTQEQADQRAQELLARVGLPDKANAYPAQLSGGQQPAYRDCARACDEPGCDAVRRADICAGSGDGRRGSCDYEGTGRRWYDHGSGYS